MHISKPVFLALMLASALPAAADDRFSSEQGPIRVETVADRLHHPWGMAELPDGSILVTERRGRLLRLVGDTRHEVAGVPQVAAFGQGGLLDIAVDEDFASTRRLWLTYSEPGAGGASTALGTATLSGDGTRLEGFERLWAMSIKTPVGRHFGSRIVLATDGKLFVTTGDRGNGDRAQDFFDSAGAVIRLNRDGTVPSDNPFANGEKGLPELWSKGHRNVQGAAWDAARDRLWTLEHGARGGDEINAPQPGRNYGWPVITYGTDYDGTKIGVGTAAQGYEQPLYYWDPSIAPSGLAVYDGDLFAQWKGDLLVGALKYQLLSRLDVENGEIVGEERMLEGDYGRIRDVRVFGDGAVWLLTDEANGKLLRITPAR
ncbi:MAG: PQQ-dependent sugar dehydrogenase [Pseudomonadota bacterium]|nr:PQQ-dependent sugar dehydrogenase [Pseudomonadota bacterium]